MTQKAAMNVIKTTTIKNVKITCVIVVTLFRVNVFIKIKTPIQAK